ncbi:MULTISPECIES: hypothetical protein [unclassified Butyrivibrio]|uniref:hypothetical protein n=1 Tax=unclassified Butyrivibrio TaxID=2639466 RepID=UPI0003B61DA8|nr:MULTISPECIES: hypothetical protein [unclassified Butyrivibrio]SDB66937.1 hypothetical protein SAMN02910263_03899 [Butyrivibrio sp. INlla16]
MEEIYNKLTSIPDAYFEFIDSVMAYVKKKPERIRIVADFLNKTDNLLSSDVLRFIISQPDFFEDDVLHTSRNCQQA